MRRALQRQPPAKIIGNIVWVEVWVDAQPTALGRLFCSIILDLLAEGMGAVRAKPQVSNLPHYAATGVKAQAFVLVLFSRAATS